jgi:NADPH:quinone reductase-like Zn-dependent oxidoreductase
MKVVIAHRTGQAKIVELPEPNGARNYITVRVSHSAVVLPDELAAIEQAPRTLKKGEDGMPLGSCASGTIMSVGEGVKTLKTGLRVAVTGRPYVYHASQLVVPEFYAVELPKKVNHEEGSFVGLGAIALNMIRIGDIRVGETVLIHGADLIGLLAVQLVKVAGAIPILVDESEFRLNKAKAVGALHVYTPGSDDLLRAVDTLTQGVGVDCALLGLQNDIAGWKMSVKLLREAGVLVLGPSFGEAVSLSSAREKSLDIRSAMGAGAGFGDKGYALHGTGYSRSLARWTVRDNMRCFCQFLAERKVQISPLLTDRMPLERATTTYDKAARGRDAVLAAVLSV